jgi:NADPH:quinone reductase-like Zn-dependent oxidoreductase
VSVKSGLAHFRELANILKLVEDKTLQVMIDRSFPLTAARQHSAISKSFFGKVVLTMS